jgi:hypothetical protein
MKIPAGGSFVIPREAPHDCRPAPGSPPVHLAVTLVISPSAPVTVSRSATGYRIGLGTEYWFTRHWGLRAGWHQQNAGGVGSEIAGGIAFRF